MLAQMLCFFLIRSSYNPYIFQNKTHTEVCGLSRVTGATFLERDIAVEFYKDSFLHHKPNVIPLPPLYWGGSRKPEQIEPKLSAWLDTTRQRKYIFCGVLVNCPYSPCVLGKNKIKNKKLHYGSNTG